MIGPSKHGGIESSPLRSRNNEQKQDLTPKIHFEIELSSDLGFQQKLNMAMDSGGETAGDGLGRSDLRQRSMARLQVVLLCLAAGAMMASICTLALGEGSRFTLPYSLSAAFFGMSSAVIGFLASRRRG